MYASSSDQSNPDVGMIDTTSGRIEDDRAGDGPKHDARRLTDGGNTATIVLDGQSYVLRITRTGKLILTK